MPGKAATEIAVGYDGLLYIIDVENRIFVRSDCQVTQERQLREAEELIV